MEEDDKEKKQKKSRKSKAKDKDKPKKEHKHRQNSLADQGNPHSQPGDFAVYHWCTLIL